MKYENVLAKAEEVATSLCALTFCNMSTLYIRAYECSMQESMDHNPVKKVGNVYNFYQNLDHFLNVRIIWKGSEGN